MRAICDAYFAEPSEALAQAVVEARARELGERRVRQRELDVDVLARGQLAGRAAVDVDLDRLLAARVVDRQQVVGRHHERAGGQRVRRDEGDDEAAHAPRQDRAAVGEVVAGRALRGGDHEPVAAHAPDLLPRQPVGEVGDAHARLAVHGDVVDGGPARRRGARRRSSAARARSNSPANARSKSSASPSGSSVARKPTSPKLIANTGTPVPANSRSAVRIVPSPPSTMQRSASASCCSTSSIPVPRSRPCLRTSSASNTSVAPARRAAATSSPRASAEPPLRRRWVITTALTRRPRRAARRRRRPRAPPSPSHTNVSRLPAGPGQARGGEAQHRGAQLLRAGRHGAQRGAPRLGVAHHAAAAHVLAAGLELRLDHRERVEALGGARQHGREHLAQRDEADVEHDQVGRVGQLRRLQRAGVGALDHRHPRVLAQRPVELAVGDVERDDVLRARLQQAVREPAGRGADVEAAPPRESSPRASSALRSLIPPRET